MRAQRTLPLRVPFVNESFDEATFLFTDIEGSTVLWEQEPGRMLPALARHDALARAAVEANHGTVVKMTGDGMHAAFRDPVDAISATLSLQLALEDLSATTGVTLRARCGIHLGEAEFRDNDYFGSHVNRAARIMSAANGGQMLLSTAVVDRVRDRLPEGISLRDLGAARLRGLARPEQVYQLLHPRLRQDFPVLRSLEATPHNLPQPMTSFVGRAKERAEIQRLLRAARLVTLLGTGGIGKTRLSLQVGFDLMEEYPDGVWFVELAPLTDARLVPRAIATVLGVKEHAGRPLLEALIKHLADRRLLLILDNCEHLVHACAEVVDHLLKSGPHLKVLASSREHLHVAAETTYPVPALALPDPGDKVALDALLQYEALHLFVDRAAALLPTFRLSDQNAGAVIEICRRLDGIPLAIELAAARVRSLSVENIASRLDDCFRLLTTGNRTAQPRQQTLRALIDWSYDLLSEMERALFRSLAVFAGGWTLEALEAVGAGGAVVESDVLDLLSALVEKSLVAVAADGSRYSLLETVRQYAQERLNNSDEADSAGSRHFAFYLDCMERIKPELFGPHQGEWLARLDLERENLLAAHAWASRSDVEGDHGLRLVNAVKMYWFSRGLLGLGHRVMVEALARPGAQARTAGRGLALFGAGQLCCALGRYAEAQSHLLESLAIARDAGDERRVAAGLQPLAMAAVKQGDRGAAQEYLEEALALLQKLGDKHQLASTLNGLAQLHRLNGDLDRAEPLYQQVLEIGGDLGDQEIAAIGLLNLAMVAIGRGSTDQTRQMLLEALGIGEDTGSRPVGQSVLEVASGLASLTRDWVRAAQFYGMAEAQAEVTGNRRDAADDAFLTPQVALAREALGAAAFATAEAAGRALMYEEATAAARAWLENCR